MKGERQGDNETPTKFLCHITVKLLTNVCVGFSWSNTV